MAHLPDDDLPSTFDVVVVGTGKRRAISVSLCISVPTYLCFLPLSLSLSLFLI